MKLYLLAIIAAMTATASLAAPKDAGRNARQIDRVVKPPSITGRYTEPTAFTVPPTTAPGAWLRLCVTELRYIAFTDDYVHSGFAKTPADDDYYFAVMPSGIIIAPAATPVLVPVSESFAAPATPDLWGFLREAAEFGKWVEFYAWAPDPDGVRRVTQVRRQYPSVETAPCSGG